MSAAWGDPGNGSVDSLEAQGDGPPPRSACGKSQRWLPQSRELLPDPLRPLALAGDAVDNAQRTAPSMHSAPPPSATRSGAGRPKKDNLKCEKCTVNKRKCGSACAQWPGHPPVALAAMLPPPPVASAPPPSAARAALAAASLGASSSAALDAACGAADAESLLSPAPPSAPVDGCLNADGAAASDPSCVAGDGAVPGTSDGAASGTRTEFGSAQQPTMRASARAGVALQTPSARASATASCSACPATRTTRPPTGRTSGT